MTYARRRRTRSLSSPGEQKLILTTPDQQEESITNTQTKPPEPTNSGSVAKLVLTDFVGSRNTQDNGA
ncbi:hypothetical protein [Pleurocapsa sp. PCC 7319]|uniref:hypothetical protein n=1 Tax=Pleurocapsa sp. PCC 7319 TaxID=118161 RepID=UPI000347C2E7|nr:hypothetical protein [Pleurocapsa sp. PCC 7319]